ncbi:hypothetical protein SAMN04489729_7070 [Amycolatopsis lurida]|nr:hypothetical protein SAMN04489729_7070 [Amycolatopsis lurida]
MRSTQRQSVLPAPADRGQAQPHPTALRSVPMRLGLATVAAMAVNALVAIAASLLDAQGTKTGLAPIAFLSLTLIGVLAGAFGWTLIAKRMSRRTLRVVVPATVLSWIPDVLLLNQGATIVNVVGLMLMHLVVAAAVVLAFRGHNRTPINADD